ncbi:hypothetical protein ABZ883_14670 [Streptomyces sp. NPDC046977]|uniref:hypothetical protein n=1 Tax=Streptomyces sp. NPDC046977 TaxID=3154703 RepID=UPI0033CEAA23
MPNPTVPGQNPNGPVYNIVDITPDLARKWLAQNTHNRNLRERVVNGYAADMRNGNWVEDGQSIKFAQGDTVLLDNPLIFGGPLLDGQHRLSAIVTANVAVRMLIVSNLDDSTQETMDTGAKRSLADVLKLRGEERYVPLAAVLLRAYLWEVQGQRRSMKGDRARPTHRQLLQFLADHAELRRAAEIGSRVRGAVSISASTAGLCHWLFNQIDKSDCAFFFARLTDGAGLDTDDPIYALRRVADNFAKDKGRISDEHMTALVIKGWNAYREGRSIRLLTYKPGGAAPEAYPEPK